MFQFFRNIGRIATALETIARQQALARLEFEDRAAHTETKAPREPDILLPRHYDVIHLPAGVAPFVSLNDDVEDTVRKAIDLVAYSPDVPRTPAEKNAIHEGLGDRDEWVKMFMAEVTILRADGFNSYSGIATELNSRGVTTRGGSRIWPATVRAFMLEHGMALYATEEPAQRRPRATAPEPAKVVEKPAAPPPQVVQRVAVNIDHKEDGRLPFADLLSPHVRQRANIARQQKQATGRSPSADEISAIQQALAEGRVTKCPPCTDSTGYCHMPNT